MVMKSLLLMHRWRFWRPTLSHWVAGATKTQPNVTAVLERAKTMNALYHLLCYRTTSGSCLRKEVVFKIGNFSMCSEDFIIICSVPVGHHRAIPCSTVLKHAYARARVGSIWHKIMAAPEKEYVITYFMKYIPNTVCINLHWPCIAFLWQITHAVQLQKHAFFRWQYCCPWIKI